MGEEHSRGKNHHELMFMTNADGAANGPIRYYSRQSGSVETEQVMGESALRWAYETGLGRMAMRTWISRPWVSRWYGRRMDRPASRKRIRPFIEAYGIDTAEIEKAWDAYESFNAFFTRRLRPEARPVDADPKAIVFPADGRHLLVRPLDKAGWIYRKGERLEIEALLGSALEAARFRKGAALISRLCPVDYHRFHSPLSGKWSEPLPLGERLHSVNPIALARMTRSLWSNRRRIQIWDHASAGRVAMIEIGATFVGSIRYTFPGHEIFEKGEEKGYFAFGGSCVITVFANDAIDFADDLVEHGAAGREVYAQVGDRVGVFG